MTPPIIQVEHISKSFQIGDLEKRQNRSILESGLNLLREPFVRTRAVLTGRLPQFSQKTFWALQDICFEIQQGEVVGVIGRNGAGKSTLLKILARITPPSGGRAKMRGSIAALLEVGTGFNVELTGRENIYLNGSILGMSKFDIDRKLDDIIEFAGIGQYIDTPVKRYSSGMGVRLGFAVAAHLEPDIMLVDEVLAVGDIAFQKKCLGKMDDVAKSGRTVIFVSHSMESILGLCPRTIYLDEGKVVGDGETPKIVQQYIHKIFDTSENVKNLELRQDRAGSGRLRFTQFHLENSKGETITVAQSGNPLSLVLKYKAETEILNANIWIQINSNYDVPLLFLWTGYRQEFHFEKLPIEGEIICQIEKLPLTPGSYIINARLAAPSEMIDMLEGVATLEVAEGDYFGNGRPLVKNGFFLTNHQWEIRD